MDRIRETRRAAIVGSNGFNRRSHRTNSLRDSPDEDGEVELQESVRLRDRVKKDLDRERERDRERGRERDLRERSNRSQRRRAERLTKNRVDIGGEETSDESVNEDDDEEYEENAVAGVRLVAPPLVSIHNHHHGGSLTNHHHTHRSNFGQQVQSSNCTSNLHLQHRTTFPPGSSASKVFRSPSVWKSGDEMIGVPVPRKARTASTKRSHDWISSGSNNNSSGAVSGGEQANRPDFDSPAIQGLPPTAAPVSPSSSNASVGKKLKTSGKTAGGPKMKPPKASQKPSSSNPEELEIEIAEVLYGMMTQSQGRSSKKEESREVNRSIVDAKSRNSPPISISPSLSNSSNFGPISVTAPKRKRPRQAPEVSTYGDAVSSKLAANQPIKTEVSSASEKLIVENEYEMGPNLVDSHVQQAEPAVTKPQESTKLDSTLKENSSERIDFAVKGELRSPKENESSTTVVDETIFKDLPSEATEPKSNLVSSVKEALNDAKMEIDLMAPPSQTRSSPENDATVAAALKSIDSSKDKENVNAHQESKSRIIDLQLDLDKPNREANSVHKKLQKQTQPQIQPKPPKDESSAGVVPLSLSMAGFPPPGLPPMGYMPPLQGVVPIDGNAVQPSFSQPRPKRCATHCHIARNIHCLQQFMKMSPLWGGRSSNAASLFGLKSSNDLVKVQSVKEQNIQQQILIQQALPPVAAPNLLGPAFIFPLNQQPPGAAKSSTGMNLPIPVSSSSTSQSFGSSPAANTMSFNYPANDSQYLAILPSNPYPFPVPVAGAQPLFSGSFYPSQIPANQMAQLLQAQPNISGSNCSYSSSQKQPNVGSHGNMNMQSPYPQPPKPKHHGGEDLGRGTANLYSQNLGIPIQAPNFNLLASEKSYQIPTMPPGFALSFDISSVAAQNQAIFQSTVSSEIARQNIQKKSSGGDSSAVSNDKKIATVKAHGSSQSITDSPVVTPVQANSGRSLVRPALNNANIQPELQKRSSTLGTKFPSSLSGYPPNIVPSNGSPNCKSSSRTITSQATQTSVTAASTSSSPQQWASWSGTTSQAPPSSLPASGPSPIASPRWKSWSRTATSQAPPSSTISSPPQCKASSRPATSQAPPASLAPATTSSVHWKSLTRPPTTSQAQIHNQISFGTGNQKTWSSSAGQVMPPSSNQSGGSPSMAKFAQSCSLSKNSTSVATQKSASVPAAKNQMQQQAQAQAQLFFSNSNAATGGYYMTKRPPSSSGMLSLSSPVTATTDPANVKGGSVIKSSSFTAQSPGDVIPTSYSYLHQVPAAVQPKSAEQKQPAG